MKCLLKNGVLSNAHENWQEFSDQELAGAEVVFFPKELLPFLYNEDGVLGADNRESLTLEQQDALAAYAALQA